MEYIFKKYFYWDLWGEDVRVAEKENSMVADINININWQYCSTDSNVNVKWGKYEGEVREGSKRGKLYKKPQNESLWKSPCVHQKSLKKIISASFAPQCPQQSKCSSCRVTNGSVNDFKRFVKMNVFPLLAGLQIHIFLYFPLFRWGNIMLELQIVSNMLWLNSEVSCCLSQSFLG